MKKGQMSSELRHFISILDCRCCRKDSSHKNKNCPKINLRTVFIHVQILIKHGYTNKSVLMYSLRIHTKFFIIMIGQKHIIWNIGF